MEFILVQGIGFVASFINLYAFQINSRKRILKLQSIVNIIFSIQYIFLHSVNSAIVCFIGGIRNIAFFYDNRYSKAVKNIILVAIMALTIVSTYINWNGILSFLSCTGTLVATVAVWFRSEKYIREMSLAATIIWLAHDIIIGSYAAVADGIFLTFSIMIGIYRFDMQKSIKRGKTAMVSEKSSGAVVFKEESGKIYFLILKHTLGQHWCFPKGHIEEGESEQETAIREIKEETGLEVMLLDKFRYPIQYKLKDGRIKETVFFLAKAITTVVSYDDFEIETYKWLEYDEAIEILTYENSRNALKECTKYIKQYAKKE